MARTEWSRADRIAVVGVLIAVVSCVAAIVVVPEFRQWLGLGRAGVETLENVNQGTVPPKETATKESEHSNVELSKIWLGPNNKGETPEAELDSYLLMNDIESGTIQPRKSKIQLVTMSLYENRRVYLKLSVCNIDPRIARLDGLYVWYTSGVEQSVNWQFSGESSRKPLLSGESSRKPLLLLKPSECRVVGGWSDEVNESFRLIRPLGQLFYSDDKDGRYGPIDLAAFDGQGFVRIKDPRSP